MKKDYYTDICITSCKNFQQFISLFSTNCFTNDSSENGTCLRWSGCVDILTILDWRDGFVRTKFTFVAPEGIRWMMQCPARSVTYDKKISFMDNLRIHTFIFAWKSLPVHEIKLLRFSSEFWQQFHVRTTDKIQSLIDNICCQCHFEWYFEQLPFENWETLQETK